MATTWVLVTHEAGARVFENLGPGKGLRLIQSIDHPEGRLQDGDFDADRPGRSFRRDAGDVRRAAMSRSEGPHERAVSDFARALASRLQHARTTGEYDRLVLVAPPKFLGLLRASLDSPTERCIVGSLDKDLAASDEKELVKQLGEVIAL